MGSRGVKKIMKISKKFLKISRKITFFSKNFFAFFPKECKLYPLPQCLHVRLQLLIFRLQDWGLVTWDILKLQNVAPASSTSSTSATTPSTCTATQETETTTTWRLNWPSDGNRRSIRSPPEASTIQWPPFLPNRFWPREERAFKFQAWQYPVYLTLNKTNRNRVFI